jgi:hypothetical protein
VIGDVGGHLAALRFELVRLGADPHTGDLPADLTVVQVGDLVHRGPDSSGVVALVDRYLREQPGQWIQLVGNHEAFYLGGRSFLWPERVDGGTAATIERWWADGSMHVAAALPTAVGDYLVTHAGLTAGFWRAVLGMPTSAATAATALNRLGAGGTSKVFRTGAMLGRRKSGSAGPVWADAARELVPSWFQTRMPFGQIHGHCTITDWETGEVRGSDVVALNTTTNPITRHEVTTLRGGRIIGVDPGHGVDAAPLWAAWEAPLVGPVTT